MGTITKINNLYIKGWINEEEYENLIDKHTPQINSADKIKELISSMSIEELLDAYDKTETETEKNVIKYLIIAEIENRIG